MNTLLNTVGLSPRRIRVIPAFNTRRTSIRTFNSSINGILNAVENSINNRVPLIPRADLIRNVQNARFAFNTLHQRIQLRKFPSYLAELWPYLGLPIDDVSAQLGVSVPLLMGRCVEEGIRWPPSSNARWLLLAVQFANLAGVVYRRLFRVKRSLQLEGLRERVGPVDAAHRHLGHTELHVEIEGFRFGPLLTDQQWREVVDHPQNVHRINLLVVHIMQ